jgi:asparagine synthase (glutamine-hydrolysing)
VFTVCGIVAAYGPMPGPTCAWMLDQIAHRGPDGEGSIAVADSWLGHRRLAIVDVAGGDQPIEAAQGGAAMVGNGEIYNHAQLRARFDDRADFTTRSDNEIAMQLFLTEGVEGLAAMKGMFALVVAHEDGRFVAVRDPLGIKPLYWARQGNSVLFASELKAFPAEWRGAVEVFPPGHAWTPEHGLVTLFGPPAAGRTPADPVATDTDEPSAEVLAAIRDTLIQAVDRRLMGDVPVGVFLSGGLDSSLIAAIAAHRAAEHGRRISSFAVGLEGSDDIVAARAIAEHLDTDHHEMVYTAEDLLAALPATIECIESFDPMLVHSAVPNYLLAEFTGKHVKVVLTGEGADELYAGYTHYRDIDGADALHDELVRSVRGLHNLNLQRCDRTTMAHSLEARVPFLDLDVIDLAFSLPAAWKQPRPDRAEKWLLRTAFEGWLPEQYLWRTKEQFGDGTGASTVLRNAAELECSVQTYEELRGSIDPPLRTREEAVYWQLFHQHLEGVPVGDTVGRFSVA